ncbi:hypothetical protein ACKT18_004660, partial [Salmonella enterica subsp. enterica]
MKLVKDKGDSIFNRNKLIGGCFYFSCHNGFPFTGCVRTPVYHRPDVDKDGRQLHVTEHTTRKRVAGYVHIVPVV